MLYFPCVSQSFLIRSSQLQTSVPRWRTNDYRGIFSSVVSLSSKSSSDVETIRTLKKDVIFQSEQTIKKSRFIGIAKQCSSWEDAKFLIDSINAEHPKARHVCFGFVAGSNPVQERCSDDGEPTGTAGVPILGGIKGEELSDTFCAVVRYSGGIKLGAGGLIRAYGGTARLVLREAETEIYIPTASIRLQTPSSHSGSIYSISTKFDGITSGESYNAQGDLQVTITVEAQLIAQLEQEIQDATRGETEFLSDSEYD